MNSEDFHYRPSYSAKIGMIIDKYTFIMSNTGLGNRVCEAARNFYNDLRSDLSNLQINYRKFFQRHDANIALLEKMLDVKINNV